MDNKSVFAANLKKYMELNNKSRHDVCNALGINYYTFSDWVNGKKYPRIEKVELLASYFGVLKSDLIEEENLLPQKKPTDNDGLSDKKKALIEFAETVPEDKAVMILQVMKSIVEAD